MRNIISERGMFIFNIDLKMSEQFGFMNDKQMVIDSIHDIINLPDRELKIDIIKDKLEALKILNELEQGALRGLEEMIGQL